MLSFTHVGMHVCVSYACVYCVSMCAHLLILNLILTYINESQPLPCWTTRAPLQEIDHSPFYVTPPPFGYYSINPAGGGGLKLKLSVYTAITSMAKSIQCTTLQHVVLRLYQPRVKGKPC